MIKTEYYTTRSDGVVLVRTYSDIHHTIISDETGYEYDEAIDPDFKHRTYHESENEIVDPEPPEDISEEIQTE